jgi:UDP-glucose 4-epimerase
VIARRIVITGLSNFWGAELAAQLAQDADVEAVVGIDTRPPPAALPAGVEFVEADVRSPELGTLLRRFAADAVVHNDIVQFPEPGRPAKHIHDINVIGTLQLLAACDGLPTLRALLVRGSATIYGSEPDAPAFFTEDMARQYPMRTRFQRDVGELENLVDTFARRHPEVVCTMLRMQPVIGVRLDTPITRMFRLPVVPTFLGFDPRMQFVHEDDSVAAMLAALRNPVRGPVNVAGPGTVSLTRMLRRMRRASLPIPHPLFGTIAGRLARARGVQLSDDTIRYLRYGRGVDIRRLVEEVGFTPAHTTDEAVERVAIAVRGGAAPSGAAPAPAQARAQAGVR